MTAEDSVYPDDVLSGQFTPKDQKRRRLGELETWLKAFADYCSEEGGVKVKYQPRIAKRINSNYWEIMEDVVRPKILPSSPDGTVRADRHKIASLMELVIAHWEPVVHDNKEIMDDLNARLAFYVATNIIANWNAEKCGDLYVSESFDREHRTWLKQIRTNAEGGPVFSNSATWYLVELIYLERFQEASKDTRKTPKRK